MGAAGTFDIPQYNYQRTAGARLAYKRRYGERLLIQDGKLRDIARDWREDHPPSSPKSRCTDFLEHLHSLVA